MPDASLATITDGVLLQDTDRLYLLRDPGGANADRYVNGAQLKELIRDTMAAAIQAGTGMSISVDDAGDHILFSSTATGTGGTGTGATPEEIQDAIAAALVAGSGVSITYNDVANTITIATTAIPLDAEQVVDTVAASLRAGAGTGIVYDDPAGTITITAVAGTGNIDGGTWDSVYGPTQIIDGGTF